MAAETWRVIGKVAAPQCRANAYGRGFLSLALVDRAGHRSLEEQKLDPLLKLSDQDHPPVQIQQKLARVIGLNLRSRGRRTGLTISFEERDSYGARRGPLGF